MVAKVDMMIIPLLLALGVAMPMRKVDIQLLLLMMILMSIVGVSEAQKIVAVVVVVYSCCLVVDSFCNR